MKKLKSTANVKLICAFVTFSTIAAKNKIHERLPSKG